MALLWPRVTVELPDPDLPWDKAAHLVMFAGLGALGVWARIPVLPLLGILVVVAAATEAAQGLLLPQRSADAADLLADVLGIAVGVAAGVAIGAAVARSRASQRPGG